MSDIILKIENVSKQYQLGTFGTKTIGGDVHRWWTTKVLGKEDPFIKIGMVNDRTSKDKSEFVWALNDINIEVKRGEVLGIIGKNGAGKSTLLKMLSRVTSPTTGTIKCAGRMASLLEVGTGFHPELTGLENIYLNGAILGMTKIEIKRKLEEIIDFSGCALYIDTPVKRYSSGMKVRLGFAVAAFLDPDILVVDEVLAVGDAEFQKKAIGKMQDVSKGEGRTVLFVSHNLQSVLQLCNNGLVLDKGKVVFEGLANDAVDYYLNQNRLKSCIGEYISENNVAKEISLVKAQTLDNITGSLKTNYDVDESILINLIFSKNTPIIKTFLHFVLTDSQENKIIETDSFEHEINVFDTPKMGEINLSIIIPPRILKTGEYSISIGLASHFAVKPQIESLDSFLIFNVTAEKFPRDRNRKSILSLIPKVEGHWIG